MNRIILDYLNRWKWVYASGFVIHATVMTFAWMDVNKVIPAGILLGSAFLLMFEFFRSGGSRTLLSLPVTSKQLARAWRFVALKFPVVLYLVALVLSAGFAAVIQPTGLLNFERFLILAFFQTAYLGTMFFALSGLPHSSAEHRTFADSLRGGFFGLIWGFSIPGCFFLFQAIPENLEKFEDWHWLVFAGLLAASIAGWFRAEGLVVKRAQQVNRVRSSTKPSRVVPKGHREPGKMRRFGGIPFYCFHHARLAGTIGLLMIVFNWGFMQFFSSDPSAENIAVRHQFTASQIQFVVPIMAALIGIVSIGQLRSLRGLPLSRGKTAGLLILWPIAFGAVFGLVVVGLHLVWFGPPFLWDRFGLSLAGASVLMLMVPAFLRLGFTLKAFLLILVMFPAIQLFQMFDNSWKVALPYLWMLPLILVPLAFWLTMLMLNTSYPWRAGALQIKRMLRR